MLQGTTLPWLIGALGLAHDERHGREESLARHQAARVALERLDELAVAQAIPPDMYDSLHAFYLERASRLLARRDSTPDDGLEGRVRTLAFLRAEMLDAERLTLIAMRDRGVIGDDVLRHLQTELDIEVVQAAGPDHGQR